ncbi:MAG: primase [Myxococcaceae bacterium]|nr:primase [Myxococcaceae bacterium]
MFVEYPPEPSKVNGHAPPASAQHPALEDDWEPPADSDAPPRDQGGARLTELDVSERLVRTHGVNLRHCAALGGWHVWTGTHWLRDDREQARERAKDIARAIAIEAAEALNKELFRAASAAGSASGISNVLALTRSVPSIVFSPDDANRDPWLLNCQNGTVDLRTGELRPHDRGDLVTRICPVDYDRAAVAPTFDRFLREVQPAEEVRQYLARLFGYAAVGLVREHVLGVLWGPGANGKSVLADAVTHVLGDYAKPGPSSLLVVNGHHEPHPTDVATCVGSRLVVVHETKRGAGFDSSKVKLLTGGDKLTARYMRQDYFDFSPSHTLIMLSNYRPQADATDAALWRRVQLIPFEVVIPEEKRDHELADKIRAEAAGVLRWLVDGAVEWQRVGLAPPMIVKEQTAKYRASEDVIGQFLEEHTVRLPEASVKAGTLYAAFKKWCEDSGQRAANGKDFAAELIGRGFERAERSFGRIYKGIGLSAGGEADRGE